MLPSVPQQEHHPTVWSRTGISPVLLFFRVIHAFGRPVSPIAKRCPVLLRSWKLQIKQPGSSSQMHFCTSPLHAVKPTALRMLWMPAAWMDLKNQREIPGLKTHWRLLETGGFKEPPSAGRGKTTPGNSFSWVLPSSREATLDWSNPQSFVFTFSSQNRWCKWSFPFYRWENRGMHRCQHLWRYRHTYF